MTVMPETARSTSQATELAQKVRRRIQAEQMADGMFFMTEAQLAAEYGVSRTVAREAVGRLQALGILEGRKRKGLVIRHPDPLRLLSTSLPSLVGSPEDWRELSQLRYALEVGAIELAIRAATNEQIEELGKIVVELEEALREDAAGRRALELDLVFHAHILQMTGSRLIAGMQQVLVQYFQIAPQGDGNPASAERITWEHRELYNAIRDRDLERARAMIRMQFRETLIGPPRAGERPSMGAGAGQ
jgi:GntR family transcriptional repressor for pyruvate dehydrogenase complex